MADYLLSRPGRPLHLRVWAYDRLEHQPSYGPTGRSVPLCGQDLGAGWQLTGPWAERWESHRRGGMCSRCLGELRNLTEAAELLAGGDPR